MSKVSFTAGRVNGFRCSPDKPQAFLWDTTAPGLGLRVTPSGKPAYVFQGRYQGQTVRITIGGLDAWLIPAAQEKARELQRLIDQGRDPRVVKAANIAADTANREAKKSKSMTVGQVWADYVEQRRPYWGEWHYRDHLNKIRPGGESSDRRGDRKNGTLTKAAPLAVLMPLKLSELNAATIEAWAAKEGQSRPASARLAWRLLTVFLNWCAEQPAYAHLVPYKNPGKTKRSRESLGKPIKKVDALLKEQLPAWFAAVRQIQNPVIAAYLQCLLISGARRREIGALRWDDINTGWRGLAIRDKVEGERQIPLTPYMHSLIAALPRRNEWVFSSTLSANGMLAEPSIQHHRACKAAGIDGLTLHGLRRSFKSLTEWLEIPAGVVAQLMGHKPSATAEKHYTVRPLDLLRIHHEKIEAALLEWAGVPFVAASQPGQLRIVA